MNLDFRKKLFIVSALAVFLVVADQVLKFWVRENIGPGGSGIEFTEWFKLLFVENPGAAFGMQVGPKQVLTCFRIVAVFLLTYGIYRVVNTSKFSLSFAVGLTLVTAGAFGNVIDCVLFAYLYDGGELLVGKVVDMLYFPLIRSTWPDWSPWAGQSFIFFRPVFNLADSAITCGMFYLAFFHFRELNVFMDTAVERLTALMMAPFSKDKNGEKNPDKNEE